jgi:hypothetical protein
MSRSKRAVFASLACAVLATVLLAATSAPAPGSLTVGEFAEMVAAKLQPTPNSQAPMTRDAALQKLSKAGIKLTSEPTDVLSAGEAASIFQQFGITIQAQHPQEALSRDRATVLVNTFSDTFSVRTDASSTAAGATIRTGNGAQGSPMPSLEALEDCQSMPKNKDCHECCSNLGYPKRVCGKACSNGQKSSGSEPTP